MKSIFNKFSVVVFSVICMILILSSYCYGQSEEEMQVLRLFYDESDLVVSSTRNPKHISQVAENITVVTAEQIEVMNAHTVAEILDRIPGMFISFNRDYGSNSLINTQGSGAMNTLVLVDDIPWNSMTEGSAETINIPVGIIEKIEIIKGPASSVWGSSLGGVINIITKPVGDSEVLKGSLYASYGKNESQDYRSELSGRAGKAGFYLYAGVQDSDGLVSFRFADNEYLFSKIKLSVTDDVNAGLSMSFSDTDSGFGNFYDSDINVLGHINSFYASPDVNVKISDNVNISFSGFYSRKEYRQSSSVIGLGYLGDAGSLYQGTAIKEYSWGAKGKLVWDTDKHTVVAGIDFNEGKYDQTTEYGEFIQSYGVARLSRNNPDNSEFAVYINDTVSLDKWTITPGVRYDHDSITGSFVSPSLGITYAANNNTVIRCTIARGFSSPTLASTSGEGLFMSPNPALKAEKEWSYQAGAETLFSFVWIKANLFYHDMKKAIDREYYAAGPPTYNDMMVNKGEITRKGVEFEIETLPFYNFTLNTGMSYVDIDPPSSGGVSETYSYAAGITYDNDILRGHLNGYYTWYDIKYSASQTKHDFLWDLTVNREFKPDNNSVMELFCSVHNIFNGAQYVIDGYITPERWMEAGLKFKF